MCECLEYENLRFLKIFLLLFADLGAVEGVVYEPVENLLLWTCNSNSTINKMKLDGKSKPEVVIALSENDKPRGIDVDSCDM